MLLFDVCDSRSPFLPFSVLNFFGTHANCEWKPMLHLSTLQGVWNYVSRDRCSMENIWNTFVLVFFISFSISLGPHSQNSEPSFHFLSFTFNPPLCFRPDLTCFILVPLELDISIIYVVGSRVSNRPQNFTSYSTLFMSLNAWDLKVF